jgi:hypothetical protein
VITTKVKEEWTEATEDVSGLVKTGTAPAADQKLHQSLALTGDQNNSTHQKQRAC